MGPNDENLSEKKRGSQLDQEKEDSFTPAMLERWRRSLGFGHVQLARLLGVSPSLVYRWKQGTRVPSEAMWEHVLQMRALLRVMAGQEEGAPALPSSVEDLERKTCQVVARFRALLAILKEVPWEELALRQVRRELLATFAALCFLLGCPLPTTHTTYLPRTWQAYRDLRIRQQVALGESARSLAQRYRISPAWAERISQQRTG